MLSLLLLELCLKDKALDKRTIYQQAQSYGPQPVVDHETDVQIQCR